jgi:uncharacterized lipoprotein YbaY
MKITYVIPLPASIQLPSSAKLRIEIRDTSLADAKSITLASAEIEASRISGLALIEGQIETSSEIAPGRQTTLWVHLSMNGESQVCSGDFITTRYYPVSNNSRITVELQHITD